MRTLSMRFRNGMMRVVGLNDSLCASMAMLKKTSRNLVTCCAAAVVLLSPWSSAVGAPREVEQFAVNEYFGVRYVNEPVSHDVTLEAAVPAAAVYLAEGPSQVEVLEGSVDAATRVRVWTLVSFPRTVEEARAQARAAGVAEGEMTDELVRSHQRHRVFTVMVDTEREMSGGGSSAGGAAKPAATIHRSASVGPGGLVRTIVVDNGVVRVRMPVGAGAFERAQPAIEIPGPVMQIARGEGEFVGSGYLDAMRRVTALEGQVSQGPVYVQVKLRYAFEDDRSYTVDARVFSGKPYVTLNEDFDVGGQARYIFNYNDWRADGFFRPGDQRLYGWEALTSGNPCGDFVRIDGQKALARMVIWSQFNYFGGKQETIALKQPDAEAHRAALEARAAAYSEALASYNEQKLAYEQAVAEYESQLAAYERDPKAFGRKPREPKRFRARPPREPDMTAWTPVTYELGGASIEASNVVSEPSDSLAVGAFYIRPDRWTRAKVNHVDLYMRPETPGPAGSDEPDGHSGAHRMTRGVVGLSGAKQRIAMEAWLVDGHREWAIFAVESGDREFFAKAHVREGVWPLDRLNRLTLLWNSDGSTTPAKELLPPADPVGGPASVVLMGTNSRSGLQYFNGSNGHIRGGRPPREGWDGSVSEASATGPNKSSMIGNAITAYMASDDSAYPSRRAMLPWTHPEAINPFYQGMENMNFNADLYRYVSKYGMAVGRLGHPEGGRFVDHAEQSLDMALDRYIYPGSGCWEESHNYAGHTISVVSPLAESLKNSGRTDFFEDVRLARMLEFFIYAHSPVDAAFGNRVVPPVGDHGLSRSGPAKRFGSQAALFAGSKNEEIRGIVRRLAWMIEQDGGEGPAGVEAERPAMSSRWLRGYGTVMRAKQPADADVESFVVLRAGQSWGHHHEDKGSMWFWGRNVHFFGDCSWGSPPGGTYGNPFKQGPASGTQIELVGITNWTLPCKYAAPWISDEQYAEAYDYANARCRYPFNPRLTLSSENPVALTNGYDRQVLFVHPDVLIVRDNVESNCPTVWRLHSYQKETTTVRGSRATLASAEGVTGQLHMVHPKGVRLEASGAFPEIHPYRGVRTDDAGKPFSSLMLEWKMPAGEDATWVFGVHDEDEEAEPVVESLDAKGRVTKVTLASGEVIIAMLDDEPFEWRGEGIAFSGTVGLVVRKPGEAPAVHAIRADRLTASR